MVGFPRESERTVPVGDALEADGAALADVGPPVVIGAINAQIDGSRRPGFDGVGALNGR